MKLPIIATLIGIVSLSACGQRDAFEHALRGPAVKLETEQGPIACQLYILDRVEWDQAWVFPESMTKSEADDLCVAEGTRIKSELENHGHVHEILFWDPSTELINDYIQVGVDHIHQ